MLETIKQFFRVAPNSSSDPYTKYSPRWSEKAFSQVTNLDSAFKMGLPKPASEQGFSEAYGSVVWVNVAVSAIMETAAMLPLKQYEISRNAKGERVKKEVTSGYIYDLVNRPNPYQGTVEFRQAYLGNLLITGNGFIYIDLEEDRLLCLKSQHVKIIASKKNFIDSYVFDPSYGEVEKLEPQRMIHVKTFHPDSYFYGMSKLQAAWRSINYIDKESEFWNIFWKEGGRLQGAFSVDGPLSEDDRDRLQTSLQKKYSGVKKMHRNLVLDNGLKYQQIGVSQKDAQILEKVKLTREDILAMYAVPPGIAGILDLSNYSNMEVQKAQFYERAVMPWLKLVEEAFNTNPLLSKNGQYTFEHDLSSIDALKPDEEKKSRVAEINIRNGIWTQNEARRRQWQMPESTDPSANELHHPNTTEAPLFPTRTDGKEIEVIEVKSLPLNTPRAPFKKPYSPEMREEEAKAFDQDLQDDDKAVAKVVKKAFEDQKEIVLTNVRGALRRRGDFTLDSSDVAELIEGVEATSKGLARGLAKTYEPLMKKFGNRAATLIEKIAKQKGKSLKQKADFDFSDPRVAKFIRQRSIAVAGFSTETTLRDLREVIAARMEEGTTIVQIAETIGSFFDIQSDSRAATIARTETASAANEATEATWKQNSDIVKGKEWITARDSGVRDSHQIDGQQRGLDEDFELADGEAALFPMAPGLSAGNAINCRCTTLPLIDLEG